MARDQAPGCRFLLPNMSEPALDPLPSHRSIARWLDGLSAHDDGDVAVDTDKFDLSFERGVTDLASLNQSEDVALADHHLVRRGIDGELIGP